MPDVQRISATADAYLVLQSCAVSADNDDKAAFGGKLLLCAGMGARGFAYSIAMSIAGGTFLGIESRPQRLKEALREGVCDYVVNSLDEALRILKNEVRKKTQVSVGLIGDAGTVLQEAAERGVQPNYYFTGVASGEIFEVFKQRGAVEIAGGVKPGAGVSLVVASAKSVAALKEFEREAGEALGGDEARAKWAESSPRYFPRTTPPMRSALLSASELLKFEQWLAAPGRPEGMTLAAKDSESRQWRRLTRE